MLEILQKQRMQKTYSIKSFLLIALFSPEILSKGQSMETLSVLLQVEVNQISLRIFVRHFMEMELQLQVLEQPFFLMRAEALL
jgi:hypothetical protein